MKKLLILFFMSTLCLYASAQLPQHDKDKENIIKSTEGIGHWDFSPTWFYYWFHKNYSGADAHWKWRFLKSGYEVQFKESKSNVKTVMPRRAASLASAIAKKKIVEEERKMIKKLNDEEVKRAADRNVDLVYGKYQDYFNDLQSNIRSCLSYTMKASHGKFSELCDDVIRQNDIVTSNVAYLRKTGIGYELENAKRDQGFRDAKNLMESISQQAYDLARLAHAYFGK